MLIKKGGQNCPKNVEGKKSEKTLFITFSNVLSCKSKYKRPPFFLKHILTLSLSKWHDSTFLSVFSQIIDSAVEIKFSSSSEENTNFLLRIFELRADILTKFKGIWKLGK